MIFYNNITFSEHIYHLKSNDPNTDYGPYETVYTNRDIEDLLNDIREYYISTLTKKDYIILYKLFNNLSFCYHFHMGLDIFLTDIFAMIGFDLPQRINKTVGVAI